LQASTPKFDEWKLADRSDYLVERKLLAAAFACPTGGSGRIRKLADELRQRRERTHALFLEAMQEMEDVAESLDFRRVPSEVSPN
jgi:hypothetical protein